MRDPTAVAPVMPVFPLRAVLFPGGRMKLRIFEPRYMNMAKACLRDGTGFVVCLIREGSEVGAPALPFNVGCEARIEDWDMPQLGVLHVAVRGHGRVDIDDLHAEPDGLLRGRATARDERAGPADPERLSACSRLVAAVIERAGEAAFPGPVLLDDVAWVGWRLGELLPLPLAERQRLLELDDSAQRLDRVFGMLREKGR